MIGVEIFPKYNKIDVEIEIWSCIDNRFYKLSALLDTGASISHVNLSIVDNLGYDYTEALYPVHGFGGTKNNKVYNTIFHRFRLGGIELGPVCFHASDLSEFSSQVILGYNILKEFNFTVNFDKNLLELSPRFDLNCIDTMDNFSPNFSRFGIYFTDNKK